MTGLSGVFGVLIFVTVALTAFSVGLVTTPDRVVSVIRDRRFALVLLLNCVVVPVVGYLVAATIPLGQAAEAGVILCVACAGGPLALKVSQISRGDVAWSLTSTVVLLVLNVVTLPIWSALLLARSYAMRLADLVVVLGLAILVPVLVGVLIGLRMGLRAERWSGFAASISNVTLVLAVAAGVGATAGELVSMSLSWLLVAVLVIVVLAGALGSLIPAEPVRRRAVVLTTLNRATSVALLVVGRVFPADSEVFAAAVVYGVVQTVVAAGLAVRWRRLSGVSADGPTPVTG